MIPLNSVRRFPGDILRESLSRCLVEYISLRFVKGYSLHISSVEDFIAISGERFPGDLWWKISLRSLMQISGIHLVGDFLEIYGKIYPDYFLWDISCRSQLGDF